MTFFRTAWPSRRTSRDASWDGFVLIEVLVSMTVFAVGIMAVLTAVLAALDLQKDSSLRYRAGLILQEKLAQTALVPYDGMSMRGISADGVFSWTVAGEPWTGALQMMKPSAKNTAKNTGRKGNAKDTVTDDLLPRLFQVAVDVSWQTSKGTRRVNATQLVHASLESRGAP